MLDLGTYPHAPDVGTHSIIAKPKTQTLMDFLDALRYLYVLIKHKFFARTVYLSSTACCTHSTTPLAA
jgi:hypothetical protein